MLVSEARAGELKTWVTKKLEDISDADADVLADYVLALVRSDIPEANLRRSVIENLEDFLKSNTATFVDELLKALKPQQKPTTINPAAPQFIPSVASGVNAPFAPAPNHHGPRAAEDSRKRPLRGTQRPTSLTRQRGRNDRGTKQMRGGASVRGHGSRIGKENRPMGRQGLPFDPQQAAAALWTLESMGFPIGQLSLESGAFSGHASAPTWDHKTISKGKVRCKDYDTVGVCQRGANCPYLHDAHQIIMPFGGDHLPTASAANGHSPNRKGIAARGKSKGQRGRADFSQTGPSSDSSMSNIVVENIPEEHLNEESVKSFFTAFGQIQEVHMRPESRLAVVKYESHDAAAAAYDSPKVIFDNRFVKIYWYNPRKHHYEDGQGSEGTTFDREAFERGLEEAQKRFEERKALRDETDVKVAEIQQQREEVERKREDERQRLLAKIREKRPSEDVADDMKSSTEFLRAKLKWLEEEAESLGLQPEPWTSESAAYGGGRGAYNGRGRYGGSSFRGTYRGRGGVHRGLPRGGAYNLDNRPRTVKVEGVEFDSEKDEALRQHLVSIGEFTSIEPEASGTSQTITFKDRLTAERFFYGPRDVAGVGKLEMNWVKGPPPAHPKPSFDTDADMGNTGDEGSEEGEVGYGGQADENGEMDYDVAEDEER